MLVSIIIPTYNRAHILHRSLESALQQTYKHIEIIIVDDGSTDDTRSVVAKYQGLHDDKIHYFYKENGGVASARNLGIDVSHGAYISFLDSDDNLLPEKIEKQIKEITNSHGNVCYCGHTIVNESRAARRKSRIHFRGGNILIAYLKNETTPHTNSWVIAKELVSNIRFRVGCSWGEDMEFFTKILLNAKTCYVDEALFCYYTCENGALSDFSWDKLEKDIFIWNEIWDHLNQYIDSDELRQKAYNAIYHYRIPALLVYRLNQGLDMDPQSAKIRFIKCETYLRNIDFSNRLRSLKLWIYYMKLKIAVWISAK